MPWILVNKVDSKVHEFSHFHNEWKTNVWRDDKNMKIIPNKQDNNSIHFWIKIIGEDLDIEYPTNNQVYQWGDYHQKTWEGGRCDDDKNGGDDENEKSDNCLDIQLG